MSEHIVNISDETFEEEVLKSKIPVFVDFWAPWCGPCKILAPILEEVAIEYINRIKIAKVDVDKNNVTAANYNIRGIPTLILFKDGKVVATKVGAVSKNQLISFLQDNVKL